MMQFKQMCGLMAWSLMIAASASAVEPSRPIRSRQITAPVKSNPKGTTTPLQNRAVRPGSKRHVPGKTRDARLPGQTHDSRRTLFGGTCAASILSATPPNGTQDARQPHPIAPGSESNPALRQGIGSAAQPIVLATDGIGLGAACFVLCETAPDSILGANGIASVTEGPGGTYSIVLDHAIAPGSWTTIAIAGCSTGTCFVEYLSLPGNVDGNTQVGPLDILAIVDVLNGALVPPFGNFSTDMNHSGMTDPLDILRVIDLLNGADAYSPWLNAQRPSNDDCPGDINLSNDSCAGAQQVGCGDSIQVSIAAEGYTADDLDPTSSCELAGGGPFLHDASWWYRFTASPGTQSVTVSMCDTGAAEDAVVSMFTADSTCAGLDELSCDDDACVPVGQFGPSEFVAPVTAGDSYLILVDRYEGGGGDGPYTITFTCADDVPVGACCNSGLCTEGLTEPQCEADGGVFQGIDSNCGGIICPVTADNDECIGAVALGCGDTHTINISDGYTSGGVALDPTSSCELAVGGPFTHDASWWYEFTAPEGVDLVSVSMCQTADTEDTVLTVFSPDSTCINLDELACDDDSCAPGFSPSTVSTAVVAGETYLVLVDRYMGGDSTDGPYTIEFSCNTNGACCTAGDCADGVSPVACTQGGGQFQGNGTQCSAIDCPDAISDNCADAFPISDGDTPINTVGATTDGAALPASCNEGFGTDLNQDIWFEYTANCTGDVTFSTCDTATFDTRLALYEGCGTCPVSNANLVACNDDGPACGAFTSEMTATLASGNCYTLRVGAFGAETGTGTLNISCDAAPAACVNGTGNCCEENGSVGCDSALCCAEVCELDAFCCDFQWDSNCADTAAGLCAVCSGPGACCVDGACSEGLNEQQCQAQGGLFQGGGTTCGGVECPDLANDDCVGARAMTCGDTHTLFISQGYTSGGVANDPTSTCELAVGGPFTHDASWWYEFTAPAGVTSVTVSMCETADNEDTVMTMYTAASSCTTLAQKACDDDSCAPGFSPSTFTTSVVPGQTYLVLVDRYTGGDSTDGPYTIEFNCP